MPYFVGVDPNSLAITDIYEYEKIDPERSINSIHIEVKPPFDNRCVYAIRNSEGSIELLQNVELQNDYREWEFKVLRENRNRLLKDSDWTQLSNNNLTNDKKIEWEKYRQALRDLPANTIMPIAPIWPIPPS